MYQVAGVVLLLTVPIVGAAETQDGIPEPPAKVVLPRVPVAGQVQPGPNRLELLSTRHFVSVLVDGRPVDLEDGAGALERKVRSLAEARGCPMNEVVVVVHGDKNTKVECVLALLKSVREAGATNFRLTAMADALYSADSTVRVSRSMGEIAVRLAPVEPCEGLPVPDGLPPIRVRLRASKGGQLVAISLGNRQIPTDFRHLGQRLRELVDNDSSHKPWWHAQVELHCDGELRYGHAMEAVSVVFGYLDDDNRLRRLATQVTLMIGQDRPWQFGLDPAELKGFVTAPIETVDLEELPPEKTDAMKKRAEKNGDTASGSHVTDNAARVQRPKSESPQPASDPKGYPILLQVTKDGDITVANTLVSADKHGKLDERGLLAALSREKDVIIAQGKSPAQATIIIRADARTLTGTIQQIIRICQSVGFDNFALRAWQPNQTEGR
jgi:biopolymer transport protein ExbD